MNELESGQLEATLLETADDVADDSALDAVRLEEQVESKPRRDRGERGLLP